MAATDTFAENEAGLGSPYENGAAITPADDADLANATRAIYVGVTGHLKATLVGGTTVTLNNVPVGVIWLRATRVWSTGTVASSLVALY